VRVPRLCAARSVAELARAARSAAKLVLGTLKNTDT
jgi:hypothetical protein